ncbi:hypothetical protein, partial [Burkholderia mallei]
TKLQQCFANIDTQPLAWITERSVYQLLSETGLTVFDKHQKSYRKIQHQWQAVLDILPTDCATKAKTIPKST